MCYILKKKKIKALTMLSGLIHHILVFFRSLWTQVFHCFGETQLKPGCSAGIMYTGYFSLYLLYPVTSCTCPVQVHYVHDCMPVIGYLTSSANRKCVYTSETKCLFVCSSVILYGKCQSQTVKQRKQQIKQCSSTIREMILVCGATRWCSG